MYHLPGVSTYLTGVGAVADSFAPRTPLQETVDTETFIAPGRLRLPCKNRRIRQLTQEHRTWTCHRWQCGIGTPKQSPTVHECVCLCRCVYIKIKFTCEYRDESINCGYHAAIAIQNSIYMPVHSPSFSPSFLFCLIKHAVILEERDY